MSEELFKKMATSIIDGDSDAAVSLAKESIAADVDPLDCITKGFVVGVNTVGEAIGRATFKKSSCRTGAAVGSSDTAMDNSESAPPL